MPSEREVLVGQLLTIHVEDNLLGQRRNHVAVGRLAGVHLK